MSNWLSNKPKTVISATIATAASLTAAAFLGISAITGVPMTAEFEGMVLGNYRDSVGVETWCIGETQMGRLDSGYTKEYCEALFATRYNSYSAKLFECYDDDMKKYVTPAMHAAFNDVHYNTGSLCKTGMMRALKEGKPVKACDAILAYVFAGRLTLKEMKNPAIRKYQATNRRYCPYREHNCYGVWDRRLKSHALCLQDALKLEGIYNVRS